MGAVCLLWGDKVLVQLFIDGDAFVNALKAITVRAINKHTLPTLVVSNKKISLGASDCIRYEIVSQGADEADDTIVEAVKPNDLVITADIPLANRVIDKGGHAIDHRGTLYSVDNIKQYLAVRDLMQNIRDMGETTRGPKPFNEKDIHAYANTLNSFLDKHIS